MLNNIHICITVKLLCVYGFYFVSAVTSGFAMLSKEFLIVLNSD